MKNQDKKTVTHTQFTGYSAKWLIGMLALQLVMLFFFSNVHAQQDGVGEYYFSQMSGGSQPLLMAQNSSLDSSECAERAWATYNLSRGTEYQKTYDSSRFVIEYCATFNSFPPLHIWNFFTVASGGAQYLSNDNNRWPVYREWLKKVLYLNPDTNFYCADAEAILTTFQYFNAKRGVDDNGSLAVVKFLLDSNRCLSWLGDVNKHWAETRYYQYQTWRDSVKDEKLTPLDTTLPSIDSLDLGILRGPQFAAVRNGFTPSSLTKIEYLIASENPFKEETTLRFGLADAEYMKIELYDLLGNTVYSDSKLCGEGGGEWRIDGKSLPKGALYVRLVTMGGEVKTVKLVHEK